MIQIPPNVGNDPWNEILIAGLSFLENEPVKDPDDPQVSLHRKDRNLLIKCRAIHPSARGEGVQNLLLGRWADIPSRIPQKRHQIISARCNERILKVQNSHLVQSGATRPPDQVFGVKVPKGKGLRGPDAAGKQVFNLRLYFGPGGAGRGMIEERRQHLRGDIGCQARQIRQDRAGLERQKYIGHGGINRAFVFWPGREMKGNLIRSKVFEKKQAQIVVSAKNARCRQAACHKVI